MKGCSTAKSWDEYSCTDQIPDVSTPNETKTPQQIHMMMSPRHATETKLFHK